MKPIYTLKYDSFEVRTEKRQLYRSKYRRYRQIGRLIHYYCRVRLMECNKEGRWVTIDEFWQEYFDKLRESEA